MLLDQLDERLVRRVRQVGVAARLVGEGHDEAMGEAP